jgi:hypothetical protein
MVRLILIIPILSVPAAAIPKQKTEFQLNGRITDEKSGLLLAGANISVSNSKYGTISDKNGEFVLMLPYAEYSISFSFIGYYTTTKIIKAGNKKTGLHIEIQLKPKILSGENVVITAEKEKSDKSSYSIDARGIQTMTSPLPEILLSLKTLPGVSSLNDQSAFYNVRGGNLDENLIYINGIEIYQPNLVRKGVAENPSLINPNLVRNVNLRTGVFPVNYGDKLSSVLDVSYQDTFSKPIAAAIDLSTIGLNASVSSQFNKNISGILGFRKIRYGFLMGSQQYQGKYIPDYTDFQTLINYRPFNTLKFTFLAINAKSIYQVNPKEWKYFSLRDGYYKIFSSGTENYNFQTNLYSLKINAYLTGKLKIDWTNTYYKQKENENTDVDELLLYKEPEIKDHKLVAPAPDDYDEASTRKDSVNSFFNTNNYTSKLIIGYDVHKRVALSAGFEIKQFSGDYKMFQKRYEKNENDILFVRPRDNYFHKANYNRLLLGRFAKASFSINNIFIEIGLRWTISNLNDEQLIMPRIQTIWYPLNIFELGFAAGMYTQPIIYKEIIFGEQNKNRLRAQKETRYTLSVKYNPNNNLSFKCEAYYKKLKDIISYDLKDVQIQYSGKNDGKGYAYGIDSHLRFKIHGGPENWISYSYLIVREDLLNDNIGYMPRASDRRHQFALYMEDKMEDHSWSKFHIRYIFGSGYPYTTEKWVQNVNNDTYTYKNGKRNNSRIPFYARFDVGMLQTLKFKNSGKIIFREEILNMFDHMNVLYYDLVFNRKVEQCLSGRIFNIGMRLEF